MTETEEEPIIFERTIRFFKNPKKDQTSHRGEGSYGITIPPELIRSLKLQKHQIIEISKQGAKIILRPTNKIRTRGGIVEIEAT